MTRDIAVHVINRSEDFLAALYTNNPRSPDGLPTGAVGTHDRASAKDVINAVKSIVGVNDRVRVMRLVGHGDAGIFLFPYMVKHYLISPEYVQLRKVFSAIARLEIHGCGVASETSILKPGVAMNRANVHNTVPGRFHGNSNGAGLVYLKRVAAIFNVPTTAAINLQYANYDWGFEGDTVTVYPNGKFRMDSEGTRIWDVAAFNRAAGQYFDFIAREYISKHQFKRAIRELQVLMKTYPGTTVAQWASENLDEDKLARNHWAGGDEL